MKRRLEARTRGGGAWTPRLLVWAAAVGLAAWHVPGAAVAQTDPEASEPGASVDAAPEGAEDAPDDEDHADEPEAPAPTSAASGSLPAVPPAPGQGGATPAAPASPGGHGSITGNERAALHFELAETHFAAGRYDRALVELQTVREITGSDEVLYNMARCYEALGRRESALRDYERFLAADIAGPLQVDARERAAALREQLAAEAPDEGEGPGVGTYIGLALGGAGLLVGGIFGALTLVEDGQLSDGCGATGACTGEELSSIRVYRAVADIAFMTAAIGGTAGLIALILWFVGQDDEGEEAAAPAARAAPTVLPFVLPGQGAGASATVNF